ncbi:MAG: Sodium/hydrogen exchanger [uncultured bacterium]|nr:MAG: Sodium/hydrogen exchanger [uncultured bacterium]OGH14113.1 MAG: sodium:proton exchanger [Candidatus Levybacteria bacterium RIFCSPHIGHO2_01_FULL_38_26]
MIVSTLLVGGLFFGLAGDVLASGAEEASHGSAAVTFLWIAILLLVAKAASLVEKFGQPSVLGELVAGVILGNLAILGINFFEQVKTDSIILFLAELGVVILLFQIGLESNIKDMRRVGIPALLVACIGVVVPFVLGTYIVGPLLLPNLDPNAYLFLGAALTATSVGITARVFKDLGKLRSPEAQIVLGAAVIDDVFGLIILAVVSAIATSGSVSPATIGLITAKSFLFLAGSIILGQIFAPRLGKLFSKINTGVGMKFSLAISIGLFAAFAAQMIGLAPIVGAFAAGLVLDPVHFRFFRDPQIVRDIRSAVKGVNSKTREKIFQAVERYSYRHIEDLIEPVAFLLVPIFFVMTGMSVRLDTMFNPSILLTALGITVVAFLGKLVAGLAAGSANKLIVGFGMIPRGEVGLIFATIGRGLGVVSDEVFSVIVVMVIFSTLLTPPILTFLLKRQKEADSQESSHLGLPRLHLSPYLLIRISRRSLHWLERRRRKS